MKLLLLLVIAVTCFEFSLSNSDLPEMDFDVHYDHLSEKRYPLFKGGEPWKSGRKYVRAQFQKYGIRTIIEQSFQSKVAGQNVTGVNIIGLIEGENKTGPIMIVGADYDTSLRANQHKDNTGGVASLLEVIHLFCDRTYWNPYFLNYTVIFVAFDLNTKEYLESDNQHPGSHHFIHEWLLPYMNEVGSRIGRKSTLRGAIILDSITTYNRQTGSQTLRDGFEEALPAAYKEINGTGYKGDFLGLLYPGAQKKNPIIKRFTDNFNYHKNKMGIPFRLQNMEVAISLNLTRTDVSDTINHQSHYYFWMNTEYHVLPAFLLFDTDSDRVDPYDNCIVECSVEDFLTEDRIKFMETTTNAVWKTLLDLQTTEYEIGTGSSNILIAPTMFFLIVSSVCSYVLLK